MSRLRLFLPTLLDFIVPLVTYYLLHQLGMSDFWALTLAGVGTGAYAVVNTIRRKKIDFMGILILVELAVSVALIFATKDPRIVAAKPAFYTAVAGFAALFTCFIGKPIVYTASTPIATKGDPVRTEAYRLAWEESAQFRMRERVVTTAFGVCLLLEAVLRVFIVYHWSPAKLGESFVISQLPAIVLFAGFLLCARLQVPALSKIVDGIEERLQAPAVQPSMPNALIR